MENLKCKKCHADLEKDFVVCPKCGTKVEDGDRNKGLLIFIITFIVMFIFVIAVVILSYLLVFKGAKNAINTTFKDALYYATTFIGKDDTTSKEISLTSDNVTFNSVIRYDVSNKLSDVKIDYSINDSSNNIEIFNNNSNSYTKISGFDQLIEKEIKSYDSSFKRSDLVVILTEFKKAFYSTLRESYFSKSDDVIVLDGEEVKVTKNVLTINEKNMKKIMQDTLKGLINNSSFINSLSNYTGIDKDTIKDELKILRDNASYTGYDIYFTVYTKGFMNEYVRCDITVSSDKEHVLSIARYDDSRFNLTYYIDKEEVSSGFIDITSLEKSKEINISLEGEVSYSFKFSLNYLEDSYITPLDVTDAISYSSLTEDDILRIENILFNKKTEN